MYDIINFFKNVILTIIILTIIIAVLLYYNQNKLIYMPEVTNMCTNDIKANPRGYRSPDEHSILYKNLNITTKDKVKLYGWFAYQENSKNSTTIIYFHENAGNLGFRLPFMELLYKNLKVNLIVVGYRGYGYSQGSPTEEGIMIDSEAVIDYAFNKLAEEINIEDVYIFGRSLGGAVGIYIVEKLNPKIKGLIIENTFTSMGEMVDHVMPLLKHFKNYILRNKWPSYEKISNIHTPILFIMSEKDELVPPAHMERLYSLANKAKFKHKFVIPNGTHNESWQLNRKDYVLQLTHFMDKCSQNEFDTGYSLNDEEEILINN